VVDDENAVCQIVQRMLSDEQYQVQTSQSVADALRAIEQNLFAAYVMDDKLPDASGLDVVVSWSGFGRRGVQLRSFLCRVMTQVPSR
jgi:DNA-binding response OmpR family regulator